MWRAEIMAKSLDTIFQTEKDDDLCNDLMHFIEDQCGENYDVSLMPATHRTVWLVWTSHGLIMNGGFRHLFEGYFEGDPDFQLCLRAYEDIQCLAAIEAFRDSMAYFPNSIPPRDTSKRLRHYLKQVQNWPTPEDQKFFKLSDEIERDLARYARLHCDEFRVISKHPKRQPPIWTRFWNWLALKLSRSKEQPDLPHWVGVAFAAHCAATVLPQLDVCWPGMSEKHNSSLQRAIDLARRSAANGVQAEGLRNASIESRMCAGRALMGGTDAETGELGPPDGHLGSLASMIANATSNAVEAAASEPGKSSYHALQSLSFACDVFESLDHDDRANEIQSQYLRLLDISIRKKWTDKKTLPINYRFDDS
jgi:hypothetical protein